MERDVSYGELAALGDMFEQEVRQRNVSFPCDEIREQALLDFIQQYQEGNDNPHIDLCCGVKARH